MKRLFAVLLVFLCGLRGAWIVGTWIKPTIKLRAKAPTTRYHGYKLNAEAIQRAKRWTVLISWEGFGTHARGTGILIDNKHVLTCAHVAMEDNEEMLVYFYPGYVLSHGKTVFVNRSKDLAIVEIDPQAWADEFPKFQEAHYDGMPITIIGNILGSMKWFVGYGIVSGETSRDILTDGLVLGGDSGGPWINEAGEVVALSDWGLQMGSVPLGVNGGISAKMINQFLKSWQSPSVLDMLIGLGPKK